MTMPAGPGRLWRNEWIRAFVLALGLLALLHACVARLVTVRSTSMFATLRPGDLVLVLRWPVWTGFRRGDIAVFRDPLQDRRPRWRRPLLVKRMAGLPGDTVEIRRGVLFVNGARAPEPEGLAFSHLVRLCQGADAARVLQRHGVPLEAVQPGRSGQEVPLTPALAKALAADPDVADVAPMRLAAGAPMHIFPYSPRYPWNGDDYGPLRVPRKGDTLRIDAGNLPLYDRLLTAYEGHRLSNSGEQLLLDGLPLDRCVVRKDYCFVLGDSRHASADSRYWGFVPWDHLVGRGLLLHRRR